MRREIIEREIQRKGEEKRVTNLCIARANHYTLVIAAVNNETRGELLRIILYMI